MKQFKEYVSEAYDYERHPSISREIYDANDHVVNMVTIDTEARKQTQLPGIPLLHDVQALNTINNLYLGIKHPTKYPDHAQAVNEYKKFLSTRVPHLMGHIMPTTPKPWRS